MSSQGPTSQLSESLKQFGVPESSASIAIVPAFKTTKDRPIASSAPVGLSVPGQPNTPSNEGIDLFGTSPLQPGRRKFIGL